MTDQSDWWDEIDPPQEAASRAAIASKLANVLGREDRASKLAFVLQHLDLWEAECQKDGVESPRKKGGAMKSLAIRYWRAHQRRRAVSDRTTTALSPEEAVTRVRQRVLGEAHGRLAARHPERDHFTVVELENEAAGYFPLALVRPTGNT